MWLELQDHSNNQIIAINSNPILKVCKPTKNWQTSRNSARFFALCARCNTNELCVLITHLLHVVAASLQPLQVCSHNPQVYGSQRYLFTRVNLIWPAVPPGFRMSHPPIQAIEHVVGAVASVITPNHVSAAAASNCPQSAYQGCCECAVKPDHHKAD